MRKRHATLVLHIGTFAEEDEAHKFLNSISMFLPLIVMITWFLDALLAAVYLKWIHPWRILLQEVSSLLLETQLFGSPLVRNQINGSVTGLTKKG